MSFISRYVVLVVGIVFFAFGFGPAVWGITVGQSASYGWTSSAPLTSTTFTFTPTVFVSAMDSVSGPIGVIATLVGTILVAGWCGHRTANRTARGIRRYWLLPVGILLVAGSFLFTGPSVARLLVFLVGFGCVAWWAGAQVARRRQAVTPR